MSGLSGEPWSEGPNAPRISYSLYLEEKTTFAGAFIGAMFYGMSKHTSPIHPHPVCWAQPTRHRHRPFLSMHGVIARFRQPYEEGYQVLARGPYRGHVLDCDDIHRGYPQYPIRLLRR